MEHYPSHFYLVTPHWPAAGRRESTAASTQRATQLRFFRERHQPLDDKQSSQFSLLARPNAGAPERESRDVLPREATKAVELGARKGLGFGVGVLLTINSNARFVLQVFSVLS